MAIELIARIVSLRDSANGSIGQPPDDMLEKALGGMLDQRAHHAVEDSGDCIEPLICCRYVLQST